MSLRPRPERMLATTERRNEGDLVAIRQAGCLASQRSHFLAIHEDVDVMVNDRAIAKARREAGVLTL